jgi:cyclohexanone monooxygenase
MQTYNPAPHPTSASGSFDAVVVGAGFAGLYAVHRLRKLGFTVRVFEQGSGVGGTWFWNRYPGARCDVESYEYSYSFSKELEQEWNWTERYPAQPEILKYINHVADRFDLRRDIQINTRVKSATFDDATNQWTVKTEKGDTVTAPFVIMATGCLSAPRVPDFKGIKSFKGEWYHTGDWPHKEVDFRGKRVGVIGTGSTGIQAIPVIAAQAKQVYVFQRTPNFSLPARNAPMDPEVERRMKANYPEVREKARWSGNGYALLGDVPTRGALEVSDEERNAIYEACWQKGGPTLPRAFNDTVFKKEANDTAAEFVRNKIRQIVKDPKVAEELCPSGYAIGTKRLPIDTNYFDTYNRPNVKLVNVRRAPIEEILPNGLRTTEESYELDTIVFATGYDAMTGSLLSVDIRGSKGRSLREKWAAGPRTYLGLQTADFPNLFMVTGPGSPSVLSNMITSIEQHVDWITDCIDHLRKRNLTRIEADLKAEDAWVEHVNEVGNKTLYPTANSWYMGANIPGKPRVFMPYIGGVGVYRKKCNDVVAAGYEGFRLGGQGSAAAA